MNGWAILGIIIAVDAVLIPSLLYGMISGYWQPIYKKHPATEPLPGAVARNFQSIRIELFNLGYCVHLTIDEQHLHIAPAWLLRVVGARTISLPWEAMQIKKLGKRWGTVKIGSTQITGPAWAFELAKTGAQSGE